MSGTRDCEVLIVGASPTGLALAVDLARRGIDVLVIDRMPTHRTSSRTLRLDERTLEILLDLGVVTPVLTAAVADTKFKVYDRERMVADFSWFEPPKPRAGRSFSSGALFAQWRLEEVLRARLVEFGVSVETGLAFDRLRADESGVQVSVRTTNPTDGANPADNHTATTDVDGPIRAAYVVGADGPDSSVRRAVGAELGTAAPSSASAAVPPQASAATETYEADVELRGIDRDDVTHIWYDGQAVTTLSASPGATTWSLRMSQPGAPPEPARTAQPTLRGCEAEFHRRTGWTHVSVVAAPWLAASSVTPGVADRFRVGRVFLAGEAAHPTGGSTAADGGIHDAYNLGWKLAAVLRGATEDLLDSYEAERQPAASKHMTATQALPFPLRLVRTPFARIRPLVRARLRRQLDRRSQLQAHYRESRLSQELGGRQVWPRAGDRMPDARLWSPARATAVRLHETFAGTHWTLIGLGSLTAEAVRSIEIQFGSAVRGEVIGGGLGRVPGLTLVDRYGDARHLLGRRGGSVLVVRPDGYLGLRCGSTPNIIAAYLEDMVGSEAFVRR